MASIPVLLDCMILTLFIHLFLVLGLPQSAIFIYICIFISTLNKVIVL